MIFPALRNLLKFEAHVESLMTPGISSPQFQRLFWSEVPPVAEEDELVP